MATSASETLSRRIATVDLIRGLLMIVMALDHTRDFFSSATVDATDPVNSWPALFFTRWVTHLCAPGFVALAGTSIYLQRQRGRSAGEMAKKLVFRGIWLIFMEIAIVNFGIFFTYSFHFLQVIYAIGGSFIVLAALQFLPTKMVAAYGFVVVCLHNLLDGIGPNQLGSAAWLWKLLVAPGAFLHDGKVTAFVAYPVLPWSGIMALGYAFGVVVLMPAKRRRAMALWMGVASLVVFCVLRLGGWYGDPLSFKHLPTFTHTAMSFFQLTKYPPSLQYTTATLGVLLVLFAIGDLMLERRRMTRALGVVEIYGRVPFFYYVPHFYLLHVLAVVVLMFASHTIHVHPPLAFFSPPPANASFGLPVVYAIWISVVAVLYVPCRWFAGVKARRRDWWLSYL